MFCFVFVFFFLFLFTFIFCNLYTLFTFCLFTKVSFHIFIPFVCFCLHFYFVIYILYLHFVCLQKFVFYFRSLCFFPSSFCFQFYYSEKYNVWFSLGKTPISYCERQVFPESVLVKQTTLKRFINLCHF